MSVSAAGAPSQLTRAQQSTPLNQNARAADGDYKTPGPGRSAVKDTDGDYKPTASVQSKASSAVQTAISTLKLGG
ncbi:MAG: hypothetical protein ACLPPF_06820 [Rhodomicrobium sp.]